MPAPAMGKPFGDKGFTQGFTIPCHLTHYATIAIVLSIPLLNQLELASFSRSIKLLVALPASDCAVIQLR